MSTTYSATVVNYIVAKLKLALILRVLFVFTHYQGLKYRIHFYQRQASKIDSLRTKSQKFISQFFKI
jgi:hypothetical protein